MKSFRPFPIRLAAAAVLLVAVAALAACQYLPSKGGIPPSTKVAQVGDAKITFGDWMRQVDLYRVFAPTTVDPRDPDTVKEVLDSLVDQHIVLGALKAKNYKNEEFEKEIKGELEKARQELDSIREKLELDLAAVKRLQKTYRDDYYQMRLAQNYAEQNVGDVIVTEKQKRDRYEQYVKDAARAGQKPKEYRLVQGQIELRLKADNLLKQLLGDRKTTREEDVIQKYLGTLPPRK
jgi:uncharacterized membrane-anchored protein YhcB (DUF1043 family)